MSPKETASQNGSVTDPDVNSNPTLHEALRLLLRQEDLPDVQVFKLDVRTLANAEVTVRWLEVGAEEWDGFVIASA